jgi:hypothetical protein
MSGSGVRVAPRYFFRQETSCGGPFRHSSLVGASQRPWCPVGERQQREQRPGVGVVRPTGQGHPEGFLDDPDHRRQHGRQDAFALPECMSGPSVSRDGVGSLPTVVSCLTLVPKCCCWILARAYVSARVRRGWRRRTRRRCELQARTAMPGSECERSRCRARLNGNGREFEDFLVLQVGVGSVVSASLARQIENTVD